MDGLFDEGVDFPAEHSVALDDFLDEKSDYVVVRNLNVDVRDDQFDELNYGPEVFLLVQYLMMEYHWKATFS